MIDRFQFIDRVIRRMEDSCDKCQKWECCKDIVRAVIYNEIPSENDQIRMALSDIAVKKLQGSPVPKISNYIPGIMVKCPHCSRMGFIPVENFNGNFGEITGKCPHCLEGIYIMMIVAKSDKAEEIRGGFEGSDSGEAKWG